VAPRPTKYGSVPHARLRHGHRASRSLNLRPPPRPRNHPLRQNPQQNLSMTNAARTTALSNTTQYLSSLRIACSQNIWKLRSVSPYRGHKEVERSQGRQPGASTPFSTETLASHVNHCADTQYRAARVGLQPTDPGSQPMIPARAVRAYCAGTYLGERRGRQISLSGGRGYPKGIDAFQPTRIGKKLAK
jgi:hypothetical protein